MLLEAFKWEWERYLPLITGKTLSSIYFGGGTPSLFGPQRIEQILDLIRTAPIVFNPGIEITLEANPERITSSLIQDYASAGINRVSIGVQTLDADLLKMLGRLHDPSMAKKAVETVFEAGITNISIDLMYDLPNQSLKHWQSTLHQISDLPVTHLSLYNLTIEPHTLFFKKQKLLAPLLPDAETSLAMYELALENLQKYGLLPYEISAFAKQDYYSRHNTGYWTGRPFLGFGPSAFSFWHGKRFRNIANLNKYHEALKNGLSPIDFEEELEPIAHRRELLAIQLRLRCGVNLIEFEERHGGIDNQTKACIEKLIDDQFLEYKDKYLTLTSRGILFYDTVAAELI